MFCAAIPATAAVGAKLNADQLREGVSQRLPISKITAFVMVLLAIGSITYHTMTWLN